LGEADGILRFDRMVEIAVVDGLPEEKGRIWREQLSGAPSTAMLSLALVEAQKPVD
jgi:hypothetical protein